MVNTWDLRLYAVSGNSVDLISGDFCKLRKADTVGARLYGTCPCPTTWYKNFWNKKGMWKSLSNWEQLWARFHIYLQVSKQKLH